MLGSKHYQATCPGVLDCHHKYNESSMEMPHQVAYVSIISSLLSCIASVLIVFTYARWRDIRTGSRSVITFLAIADFFTAFGYIMGSINYLVAYEKNDCGSFDEVCTIQSFITSWSSISSFVWTVALAFYLYLTLVHTKIFLANRFIPFFHVFSWGFPIIICLPLLVTLKLGYSPFADSTWCYIRYIENDKVTQLGLIFIGGKLWEILAYFLVIGFYAIIKCHIRKQTRIGEERQYLSSGLATAVRKADSKLVFIPMVFVLLRMWGTLQFFYTFAIHGHIHEGTKGCIPTNYYHGLLFLGIMQAIGDGGQGWGNFILYILASGKIRKRLFDYCLPCCSGQNDMNFSEEAHLKNNDYVAGVQAPNKILSPCSSIYTGDNNNYHSIGMEPTTRSNSDSS